MSNSRMTYEQYQDQVNSLLNKLDSFHEVKDQAGIIKELRELDNEYVSNLEDQVYGIQQVMFTRHGHCSPSRKHFGLNPNTSVEPGALSAMNAVTNQITTSFVASGKPLALYVSPMLRAKQTAAAIVPAHFSIPFFQLHSALVENSQYPSGFLIESADQLDAYQQQASHDRGSWIKNILFKLSSAFYRDKFTKIQQKSAEANTVLSDKLGFDIQSTSGVTIKSEQEKIKEIKQLIHDGKGCFNYWFIGHGKNFRAFFESERNEKSSENQFNYAETKQIIYYQINREQKSFIPPYSLVISQETGLVTSKKSILAAKKHQKELQNSRIKKGAFIGLGALLAAIVVASVILTAGASVPLIGLVASGLGVAASAVGTAFGLSAVATVTLPLIGVSTSLAALVGATAMVAGASLLTTVVGAVSGLLYHKNHPQAEANSTINMNVKGSYANTMHPILLDDSADLTQTQASVARREEPKSESVSLLLVNKLILDSDSEEDVSLQNNVTPRA